MSSLLKLQNRFSSLFMAFALIACISFSGLGNCVNISLADEDTGFGAVSDFNMSVSGSNDTITVEGISRDTSAAINKGITFVKWITLIGTIVLMGVFVVNLIKLGSSGTNASARSAAQSGLVWSGIAAAVLSIASTVFFFLNSALRADA